MQAQNPQELSPPTRRLWRPTAYTFVAVFLAILLVGAAVAPGILNLAENLYLDLVNDVNARQARAMTAFLKARLDAGVDEQQAIDEFQVAISGSDVDRGYVCLIDQGETRYLSHPDLEQLGMDVKPGAAFTPDGDSQPSPWSLFLKRGDSGGGHLSYGPQMAQEMIHFTTVDGKQWTVSSHENLSRVDSELARLRQWLIGGSVLLSLLVAIPASAAARAVSQRQEKQIQRAAELERRLLEKEDARKTEELEQARQLQLSLIPDQLPKRHDLELAAHMETATEVGGDTYDVIEREDGSVLLAIGDATGHGLQSGMMVVAVKSLLANLAQEDDLVATARRMAIALRSMKLGRLHMAYAIAHLDDHHLRVVGAGMPPALIHRGNGTVDELPLSGAPLGSPIEFPYAVQETRLVAGDTVLMMSDGLPELRGESGAELGYNGVARLFREAVTAAEGPEDLVAQLRREISEWSAKELDDDVTLLAFRAK